MTVIEPALLAPVELASVGPDQSPAPRLSNGRLAIYALPSIPIAFLYLPVALLLPAYYASNLHVSLAAIGGFLLISRSLDVVLDPMIGRWSDNTRSRFGRRKLWMLCGAPLLMTGAYILFMPPIAPTGWYLLIASFVIYAGGSTVGLPYSAWGTEIVDDYHGRARMAGFREGFGVVGGLLAACVPAITGQFHHGVDRFTMGVMGWMIIGLTPLTVLIAICFVGEPPARQTGPTPPLIGAMRAVFKNGPFRIFCGAYVLFSIGGSIVNATMIFYITDYLNAPGLVGATLLASSLSTIGAVPLWLWISRRIGKHRAVAYSLFLAVGLFALIVPWLKPGQGLWFVGIVAVLGACSSGYVTLPLGIIGDVIDYDTLKNRLARGGLYWGVWSFAQKVAPAFGIAATLPLLQLLGFHPGGHNTPAALAALKAAFCFGVIPFLGAGGLLLLHFPIDSRRHAIIRRRIESRRPAPGPLPTSAIRRDKPLPKAADL